MFSDGPLSAPASFLFASVPASEREPFLAARGLGPGPLVAGLNCLLIDLNGARILVDAGTGGRWHEGLGGLADRLRETGVGVETVDLVLITHAHPDHIGGLVDGGGARVFPQADYAMSRVEWGHWTDDRSLEAMDPIWAHIARATLPAIASSVRLLDDGEEVVPGISVVSSPGHTPGHMALELRSRGESLLCVGDAIGHPVHVERPDWLGGSDGDPSSTLASRHRLMHRAHVRGSTVFANHFVYPGLGRIDPVETGFRWAEMRHSFRGHSPGWRNR